MKRDYNSTPCVAPLINCNQPQLSKHKGNLTDEADNNLIISGLKGADIEYELQEFSVLLCRYSNY